LWELGDIAALRNREEETYEPDKHENLLQAIKIPRKVNKIKAWFILTKAHFEVAELWQYQPARTKIIRHKSDTAQP